MKCLPHLLTLGQGLSIADHMSLLIHSNDVHVSMVRGLKWNTHMQETTLQVMLKAEVGGQSHPGMNSNEESCMFLGLAPTVYARPGTAGVFHALSPLTFLNDGYVNGGGTKMSHDFIINTTPQSSCIPAEHREPCRCRFEGRLTSEGIRSVLPSVRWNLSGGEGSTSILSVPKTGCTKTSSLECTFGTARVRHIERQTSLDRCREATLLRHRSWESRKTRVNASRSLGGMGCKPSLQLASLRMRGVDK